MSAGPDKCWPWIGAKVPKGYGTFCLEGHRDKPSKTVRSHRLSYELSKGPVPEGLYVCHTCDHPDCQNPSHLYAGTSKQNRQDASERGRIPDNTFTKNGNSRLTEEEYQELFDLRSKGWSYGKLAERFGISQSGAHRLIKAYPEKSKELASRTLSNHYNSKLTEEQYERLFERRSEGISFSQLSREFGLSPEAVRMLIKRHPERMKEGISP